MSRVEPASVSDRIEQLSAGLTTSISGNDAPEWASSLLHLEQFARNAGEPEVAGIARELAINLPEAGSSASVAAFLEAGLTRLQAAVRTGSAQTYSIAQDPELIGDFVLESREHLSAIERNLLVLEQNEGETEAVHAIFRSFHTIKGLAGFLELDLIQQVAHEVENVLDRVRQGELSITGGIIDIVLESRDYIGCWLEVLEGGPQTSAPEGLRDISTMLARIPEASSSVSGARATGDQRAALPEARREAQHEAQNEVQNEVQPQPPRPVAGSTSARSIKVSTDKLDHLVDMVGEMVIAQSLVRHDPDLALLQNSPLMRNLAQLGRITNDVQRTAMSMRMVPIGSLFQKMARLVRDLSRKFDKQIQFESVGEEVELDRHIVEELADPLMHMVRNSIDHGIEPAEERSQSSRNPVATIALRAFHRSGQIVIEVSDDGRGINRARVLRKAREKGLIGANETPSDMECLHLIMQPGFSTVDTVTDISGRGVGMDVVRKQILRLRGNIEIHSVEGRGTTFSLRLPLTLAIIEGLVVVVGSERFIIPLGSVRELLRPRAEQVSTVENQAEVVLIRDQLLPIIRLHQRFRIQPKSTHPHEGVLVVADVDGCFFCLLVDELAGKQEVVIKSLGSMFQHVAGAAGAAILGDGRVGLILDLKGIFAGRRDV